MAPYKNSFYKQLLGVNAQVLISGSVAYTAQATMAAFQDNAAQGEMGVFDRDTNALVSGGGAAAVTEWLFVALKRDSQIERSVAFRIQDVDATRTAYSAPVKEILKVQFITDSLVVGDLTYRTNTPGAGVSIVQVVAGANTALSVAVVGNVVTVNLATNGGSAATSTATAIAAAVAASAPATALLYATVTGTGATVQGALAQTVIPQLSPVVVAGNIYSISIVDLTPDVQPFPTYNYSHVAVPGDTVDTIGADLAAQINNSVSITNSNRDIIVSAAFTTADNTLTLTALNFGTRFRVILPSPFGQSSALGNMQNSAVATITTPCHIGSGWFQHMQLLQAIGDIYKGVTTNYPAQGQNPADWGAPSDLVNIALGYNLYWFSGYGRERSKSPHNTWFWYRHLVVGVPSTGTTPEVQIKAIFGL